MLDNVYIYFLLVDNRINIYEINKGEKYKNCHIRQEKSGESFVFIFEKRQLHT